MRKNLSKVASLVGAFTTALLLSCSGAQASNVLSGVAFQGGSNHASSTFLSSDPAYGSSSAYPTYLLQSKKPGIAGTGVNFPAVGEGFLSNVGNMQSFGFYYDVANLGPSANGGLAIVAQTRDGFSHLATPVSTLYDNGNNFNVYEVYTVPSDYSPAFTSGNGGKKLASASFKFFTTNAVRQIYFFYPYLSGNNSSLTNTDFGFKTLPDSSFVNN